MGKKILVISNMYPSKKFPHYGVFVKNLNEVLINKDLEVDLIYLTKSENNVFKLIKYLLFFLKIIYKLNFRTKDMVYIHYPAFSAIPLKYWKLNKNASLVVNVHGNDLVPEDTRDEKFIKFTEFSLSIADKVVCPSEYFSDYLINNFKVSKDKVIVFPSAGVDTKVFHPDMVSFNSDNKTRVKNIGFVSRIEKNKGWDTFILAAEKLIRNNKKVKFFVVGEGKEKEAMVKMIRQKKLDSFFELKNFMVQQDLREFYNKLDIFCFPTRRKSESLGLVGLEAMACGSIVIASNCYGPSSYMIDGVNGFTFSPKSSTELAERIQFVLNLDETTISKVQRNGYQTVNEYSKNNIETEFVDMLKRFV